MPSGEPIVGLGARTDYLAVAPGARLDEVTLLADERLVLAAMGRAATIQEIVSRAGDRLNGMLNVWPGTA